MKVLAIIPARGGSKGVPGKNVRLLGGKPLIMHAVDCAKEAKSISEIVVTSDADEIIAAVEASNITIVKRPETLAQDDSNVVTAVKHVLDIVDTPFDLIVLLQPTAPLRTGEQLDEIIAMFAEDAKLEGVISVVPMDDIHPARMYNLGTQNEMISYMDGGETKRRQELAPVYYRNGCFYAVRVDAFLQQQTFMPTYKKAYIMNPEWLANIDTPRDFAIASVLYAEWKK